MPDRVRITDVAPRDGLQNEPGSIPTEAKARLVRALARSGVDEIEVTSFVSARSVPQLGDAAELCDMLAAGVPSAATLSALVPNEKGLEGVLAVNRRAGRVLLSKVAVFTAASETFTRRNINAGIAESIARFAPVVAGAHGAGLAVRGYISCAVACPFEGPIDPWSVAAVAGSLADLGVDEIDLGDTIGAGTRGSVGHMLETVMEYLDDSRGWSDASRLTLHLHDTAGHAADCARAAMEMGLRSFDSAAGGLGGCPFASTPGRRAPGNIATSTLVRAVRDQGLRCAVDPERFAECDRVAAELAAIARSDGAAP